ALAAGFAVAYGFHGHILHWLNKPLPPDLRKPVTFNPIEPFTTSIWVSLWAGLLLALPIVFWQLWAFLAPAIEEHRQRSIAVLVVLLPGVDPVSTILSVIPLVTLYVLAIGLATFFEPRWRA